MARPASLANRCPLSEKNRAPILLRAKSQNRPSSPSSVLRAHAPRAMAVDVEAARRLAPGKKERAKPAKAKSGLWKTEGDAPSGKEKPARSFAKASRSSSADPKRAPQKPARGSGKPPRAPRDAKKGAEDASARRASTPPLGVSPNELVAGLAGSLAMCVVSGVSKLVRRKLGGRACVAKKDPEGMDLSAEARDARLDAVKAELRDALEQLREQRKSMDHLRKQNQAFVRENQLLKVAHANANANAETRASAAKRFDAELSSRSGSPSGPLSRRASPARSAPASPEADAESRESQDAIIARLLSPLDADADEAARVSKTLAARALRGVLGFVPVVSEASHDAARADERLALSNADKDAPRSMGDAFACEEDAWAGVPRGSPAGAGSEFEDARSARSAASGFSGISDLSTLSAAEAMLSRMRTRHVLMARIKNHR